MVRTNVAGVSHVAVYFFKLGYPADRNSGLPFPLHSPDVFLSHQHKQVERKHNLSSKF